MPMPMPTDERKVPTEPGREIARRFVELFKESAGRGPSAARTYFGEDLVVVVLEETLTKVELALAEENRIQLVRELRRSFQATMREAIESIVEEQTGRRVQATFNDHAVQPDFAVCAFILERPEPDDPAASRIPALSPRHDPVSDPARGISRGMTNLFKDYAGRGPTAARTYILQEAVVVVVLEDTLTKAEQSLARDERETIVREIRRHFQGAMHEAAVNLVEEHLERRVVRAFLSDSSIHPDYAIEVFILKDGELPSLSA